MSPTSDCPALVRAGPARLSIYGRRYARGTDVPKSLRVVTLTLGAMGGTSTMSRINIAMLTCYEKVYMMVRTAGSEQASLM